MEASQYRTLLEEVKRGNADAAVTRASVDELRVALQGDLKDHTKPGIIADVRSLKEAEASRVRLFWVSVGAAVTSVIGAIAAAVVAAVTGRGGE